MLSVADLVLFLKEQNLRFNLESLAVAFIIAPLIYVIVNELVRYNARIAGIKGPPGLPVIGNLWDIRVNAAEKYRHWAQRFGDVYQIQLGNVPVVVVNSAAAGKSIFGQNAQAMSSRPEFYTFHKVGPVLSLTKFPFALVFFCIADRKQGSVRHGGNHHRYFALQRVAQAPSERGCLGAEQTVHSDVHLPP